MRLALRPVPSLLLVTLLLLAAVPVGSAGSAEDPEMEDRTGDVDPLSLVGMKPEELQEVQGNLSMFDIKNAYVAGENPSSFWFIVDVVDLDGGIQSTPLPVPPPAPLPTPGIIATFDVHFQTAGAAWIARATLEPQHYVDATQQPPVAWAWFTANFTLHQDDADQTYLGQIYGLVSAQHEAIMMNIPKDKIGEPATGARMEGLYAVSKADGQAMDFAPDAVLDPTAVDPAHPLRTGVRPQFGIPYDFGQYRGSGAPAKLELKAMGETTFAAETGETVELPLTLKNLGDRELEVRVGLITPRGWTATLSPETVTLGPGSSDAIVVHATPAENAARQGVLKVTATTSYETQTVVFVLQHGATAAGGGGTGTGGNPGGSDTPGQSLSDETEDSPMVGFVAALAAVAALGVVSRRRRV